MLATSSIAPLLHAVPLFVPPFLRPGLRVERCAARGGPSRPDRRVGLVSCSGVSRPRLDGLRAAAAITASANRKAVDNTQQIIPRLWPSALGFRRFELLGTALIMLEVVAAAAVTVVLMALLYRWLEPNYKT
jgi:hypothetical protein